MENVAKGVAEWSYAIRETNTDKLANYSEYCDGYAGLGETK